MAYIHPMDDGGAPVRETWDDDAPAARLSAVDLNLLVPLHALLEEASVTRAAARVNLSQPAMSHALRRIRRLLGDEVLVGRGPATVLTPRAQQLRAPLRELLHRTAVLLGEADFDPRTDARQLTVAMTSSTATVLGAGLARLLEEEAPNLRLRIVMTMELSDVLFTRDGVDLVLLSEAFETEQPRHRVYADEWVVVSGSPELTDETAERLLAEWPHVVYDTRRLLRPYDVLRDRKVRYSVHTRVNDTMLLSQLVAGSRRVAVDRRRGAEIMARALPVSVARFPFPVGGVGTDAVWNPYYGDADFRAWMLDLLRRAAAGA